MLVRLNAALLILELIALGYWVVVGSWIGVAVCLGALVLNVREWIKIAGRR